jgi:hypothetical protein
MLRPGNPSAVLFVAGQVKKHQTTSYGGLEFTDCTVKDQKEPQPILLSTPARGLRLTDVSGTITMDRDGKTVRCKLKNGMASPTQSGR